MGANASSCSSNLFGSLIVVSRLIQILIGCSWLCRLSRVRTVSNSSSSHTEHCATAWISDASCQNIVLVWSHLHSRLWCVSVWLIIRIWACSSDRSILGWSLLSLKARTFIASRRCDISISWSVGCSSIASNWRYRIALSPFRLQVILLLKQILT